MPWNFSFIIPGQLAGLARPGGQAPLGHDLRILTDHGIGTLVSLTDTQPDPEALQAAGLDAHHLPVRDFTPPTIDQIKKFVTLTSDSIRAGKAVAVHCTAGMGRTGTMLACYLVSLGETSREAIDSVRAIRPGSIETPAQEARVHEYFEHLQNTKDGAHA